MNERVYTKTQPCGCVVCTCEDPKQCQGCGARNCGTKSCVLNEPGRPRAIHEVPSPAMSERRYGGNTIAQELRETHASTNYQREVSTHAAQWIEELEREVATLRADRERLEKIEAVARQLVKDNHDGYDALGGADFDELRAALGIARWGDAAREAGDE